MAKKPKDFKPKTHFGPRHRWPGAQRCQGWRPKLGRQCKKLARKGKRTCRTCGSGGRPPLHGKFTSVAGFSKQVQKNLADPRHLSLRSEIDILGLRLDGLAYELLSSESQPMPDVAEIQKLLVSQGLAITHQRESDLRRIQSELVRKVDLLAAEEGRWREYRSTARDFASLVASESAHDLANRNMIPVAVVWEFIRLNQSLMFQFLTSVQRSDYMIQLRALIGPGPAAELKAGQMIEGQFEPAENRKSPSES